MCRLVRYRRQHCFAQRLGARSAGISVSATTRARIGRRLNATTLFTSRAWSWRTLSWQFDATVHRIVAQPFRLTADVDGQERRHILDYLWDSDEGPVVVDVVRSERMTNPRIVVLCAWTKDIVESLGWSYLAVNEPVAARIANVRFLAGYRREWLINQDVLAELRCRRADLAGRSIDEAEKLIEGHPRPLVRSALLSMLWRHELEVNLDVRLERSTVLEWAS